MKKSLQIYFLFFSMNLIVLSATQANDLSQSPIMISMGSVMEQAHSGQNGNPSPSEGRGSSSNDRMRVKFRDRR